MKKIIIFIAVAMAFLATATMPSTVSAYGGLTHEWIVLQAFDLFKCPGYETCDCPQHYYPELELPYATPPNPPPNWPWYPSNNGFTGTLVGGGAADDHSALPGPEWDLDVPTGTHFWDADDDNEFVESYQPFYGHYKNAMDEARRELKLARQIYLDGNKPVAYDYLSHVIHHIADMTVPEHAHVMPHALNSLNAEAGDSYDDWCGYVIGDSDEDSSTFEKNHAQWTSAHARAAGGLVEIPNDAQNGALAVYNSILQNSDYNDGWWPDNDQLGADFYYLIYTANQYGDYYGSMGFIPGTGDGDGDSNDRRGWMNYGAPPFTDVVDPPLTQDRLLDNSKMLYCTPSPVCPALPEMCPLVDPMCWVFFGSINDDDRDLTRIASTNLPYAYRAVATLIKSFRDSIDTVPPVTAISLDGTAGHDGWYRSDVLMTLSATDNLDNLPYDPGLKMTQWRYAGATGYCWFDYTNARTFDVEGITQIKYRSIDGLGNEETPLAADIKIDKTDPVISITSPDKDGFYLTSDTLTIDFAVSDNLPGSGIYSFSAKLDGVDVSDGQVFDLDNMGGWHTLVVTAEDYAGNQSSLSVTFSIKIHATVDFRPETFNSKSSGNPIPIYVEFPAGYNVSEIKVSKAQLIPTTGWFLLANSKPTAVGDYDHDKVPDRLLQFRKQDMITALAGNIGNMTITVIGELNDKTEFYGTDTVLVTSPPKK